jgi:hypothetical protein
MRKGIVIIVLALLLSIPVVSAGNQPQKCGVEIDDMTIIRCIVKGESIQKEMSASTIQDLIDMGASHKEDFITIYDRTKSDEEVATAFENVKPFFQALIDNGLTDKTVDELHTLFTNIREKIRQTKYKPAWELQDGPRPMGIWNGIPTPLWANIICGQFDAGFCVGFAGGTHLLIPTVGADVFLTYGFQGTSVSVGGFGYTIATMGFNFVLGFVGILLTLPLVMFGPYFLAGMSGMLVGIGV